MTYLHGPADQIEMYRLRRQIETLTIRANLRWRRLHEVALLTAVGAFSGGSLIAAFVEAPLIETIVGICGPVGGVCVLWAALTLHGRS